jgi:hypothetical protein
MTIRVRVVILAGVALVFTFAGALHATASDWTDADCSHWDGTPQYAECVQAHAQLAESDCSRWTPGEKEFVKCQHEHNVARVQRCQAQGESMRRSARALGWDGTARIGCPLLNEQTGAEE